MPANELSSSAMDFSKFSLHFLRCLLRWEVYEIILPLMKALRLSQSNDGEVPSFLLVSQKKATVEWAETVKGAQKSMMT